MNRIDLTTMTTIAVNISILVVFFVLTTPTLSALDLRIIDIEGQPVAGARISVIGSTGTAIADSDGQFTLDPDPELPFVLFVARADGVALSPVTVAELPDTGPVEITVAPAGGTVTVISGVVPDLEVPPALAVTVLGRSDLVQRQPSSITDALENVPGVSRGGEGRAVVPGLRGLPKHRTLIILDDGRITAERRAGPSATFLSPETIEEIEVVRGPGSVAYGSDAFGGIIRARSRLPQPNATTELRYSLLGGTGVDELGAAADFITSALGGGLLIGAQYRDFGNYKSPDGEVLDSGAEEMGFRSGYQRVIGNGVLHIGWRTDLARNVGKPAPDSHLKQVLYPDENSHRFNLGFERPGPGKWTRTSFSAAWDTYEIGLSKEDLDPSLEIRDRSLSVVDADDYELRFEAERTFGSFRTVLGVNAYGRYGLEATNTYWETDSNGLERLVREEVAIESARRDNVGVFIGTGREWSHFTFNGGLRIDSIHSKNKGGFFGDQSASNTDLSGFLAAGFSLPADLKLTVQAARGFRDPLLSDRYYRGETGRGFVTGNPELEPESSRQFDLALRHEVGRVHWALYGYLYRINDLIERYRDDEGNFLFRNRGEAEIQGLELEISTVIAESITVIAGAQYQRGEIRDDGSIMDDVPSPGVFLQVRNSPGETWSWMVRAAAFIKDDRPGPSEQEVPGYGVIDASVGWQASDNLRLQLLGRNLLDKGYLGSADEDSVLAAGRSFQLSLRGSF